MEKEEKKPKYTAIRIAVIAIILVLLVIISIGIVRFVPKALNSLANASLSVGTWFNNETATTTETTKVTDTDTTTTVATSTGGFTIRDLTGGNETISGNTSGVGNSDNAGTHTNVPVKANPSPSRSIIGQSDISVEVLSKGIIDRTTGAFIPSNSFTTSDIVVVKFKIENRGQYATGQWSAKVTMPTTVSANSVKVLGPLNSLPAGSAITGEARFESPISGNQNVTISVDTAGTTQDVNRANNIASIAVYSQGGNVSNGNGYQYGTPADLQVRVVSTGSVNSYGQFVANQSPRYGEKAAVKFEVTNIGGTATNAWSWRADISGANSNTYNAPIEAGLAPGATATFIVGLEAINNNQYYNNQYNNGYYNNYNNQVMYFNIYIDSGNTVYESNESNNTVSATVNVNF